MTTFVFTPLVEYDPDVVTAALGTANSAKLVDADIGKPVKMGTLQNYVVCGAGDEIEGFLESVDAETVNDGFSKGSVNRGKKGHRVVAKVGAGSGTCALLSYVVAAAPSALGTKDTYPLVQLGVATNMSRTPPVLGTPLIHKWKVIRIHSGSGAAGDLITIERA